MSLLHLLVVLLAFCSLNIAFAEDQPSQSQKNSVKVTNPNSMTDEQKNAGYAVVKALLHKPQNGVLDPDPTCYTMRTYVADSSFDKRFVLKAGPEEVSYNSPARNDAQTDIPLTGTYSTCQLSSQFSVKKAVQTVENGKTASK